MPKVLILTGDAAESLEVMYPYQRLLEEGYQVDIAAPSAKKLQFVVHDFVEGYDTYTEKPCGVPELGHRPDLGFYAVRSYSLIRTPRTGRRLIRSLARSATGWSGRGGRSCRLRWGRRPL
jgi:putative intracellular protease/amidase